VRCGFFVSEELTLELGNDWECWLAVVLYSHVCRVVEIVKQGRLC
jgi:hypothetical protein